MSVTVCMPRWGLTMKQGLISKWLKNEGDRVEKGDDLFEVETEKVTNVVEAYASGILFQIVVPAGTKVEVGTIVAVIADPGEKPERIEGIQKGEVVEAEAAPPKAAAAKSAAGEAKPERKAFAPSSPAARRLAKELGVDITNVRGSGPGGRVVEADVQKYHEEGPPAPKATPLAAEMARQEGLDLSTIAGTGDGGKITREDVQKALKAREAPAEALPPKSIPFTGMRKAVADNMFASLQGSAQLTQFTDIDAAELIRFRDEVREEYAHDETVKISLNDLIVMAVSRALKRFPLMNSTLVGDEILLHDSAHVGVAVALKEGLIVPVLRDADRKGLLRIAREIRELAQKAREGKLSVDEVTGGTFTVTNLGMFRVDGFTPILRPPESGILGVGRVVEKPAVFKGEICVRPLMTLSLTFDHRVVDGAPAAEFLQTLARYLEKPSLIMA